MLNSTLASIWNIRTYLLCMKFHANSFIRDMCQLMIGKFNKYWENCSTLHMIACILDPRYKMQFIEYYYREKEKLEFYDLNEKLQDIQTKYVY